MPWNRQSIMNAIEEAAGDRSERSRKQQDAQRITSAAVGERATLRPDITLRLVVVYDIYAL